MRNRMDDGKGELLRVRRELANLDEQIFKLNKELIERTSELDPKMVDDIRAIRLSLWKDKEQLRVQETIFLKHLYPSDLLLHSSPAFNPRLGEVPPTPIPEIPQLTFPAVLSPYLTPNSEKGKHTQSVKSEKSNQAKSSYAQTNNSPEVFVDMTSPRVHSGFDHEFMNANGYEVNRSSDCKVCDVWKEWKEGLNGGPAIEKLEEARKRDRKLIWWKNKNDYKYWSKQMRIIHAVESKAVEFGNVEASLQFWENILQVEFEGSISKLREALGGEKVNLEQRRAAMGVEMRTFKRKSKELLQQGLERMKQWPNQNF